MTVFKCGVERERYVGSAATDSRKEVVAKSKVNPL